MSILRMVRAVRIQLPLTLVSWGLQVGVSFGSVQFRLPSSKCLTKEDTKMNIIKTLLFLIWAGLMFAPLAMADDWPEGVEGGLEIARAHCLRPEVALHEVIIFDPDNFLVRVVKEYFDRVARDN